MQKIKLLLTLIILAASFNLRSQSTTDTSTAAFASELKKLIALNPIPGLTDLSLKEAINLQTNATAVQLKEITAPYLNSTAHNAKWICLILLNDVLFKRTTNENLRQEVVEIICRNYLHDRDELQMVDNTLLRLKAKDFNAGAKKCIASLMDSLRNFDHDICATLFAMAQIKESIPVLWKIVNRNIETMDHHDVDILASLARLNEKEACTILCNYYNSHKNRTDYRYIFISRNMAFSLAPEVINCLVNDFKSLDLSISFHYGDSGYCPSWFLAGQIVPILNNYPGPRNEYSADTKHLMSWLNTSPQLELVSK